MRAERKKLFLQFSSGSAKMQKMEMIRAGKGRHGQSMSPELLKEHLRWEAPERKEDA